MVAITLSAAFGELGNWPGTLLEARDGATVLTQTATAYTFRYPATGVDYPNYRVEVTGTGFTYDAGEATGGNITGLRILTAAGEQVIRFSSFAANTLASDFSQFWSNIFGNRNEDGNGPGPDANSAWSHLLSGNDVITGTSGDDREIFAGIDAGNDRYNMGDGDDNIGGGLGRDTIDGGNGFDQISFRETTYNAGTFATQGITVNVAAGTLLDCWGYTDRFLNIEFFEGSRFNDTFNGDDERNEFSGLRGRDVFRGGGDQDSVVYDNDFFQGGRRGIVVDLETSVVSGVIQGRIVDGFGNIDTTFDIERVAGTRFADTFVGSSERNVFWGGEGRDSYDGGSDGFDGVRFTRWFGDTQPGVVSIDLTRASGQIRNDGFGNIETAVGIDEWELGRAADRFIGNSADNYVASREGADILTGGGGADTFAFYGDFDIQERDTISDFAASGVASNRDRLSFDVAEFEGMTATLRLVNGTAATFNGGQFIYNAANDTLFWDADGTGSGAATAVVRLTNVAALSAANFILEI